jgi:type II secretion system protein G
MSTSTFFKKGPKNSKGFTLIELLIVVAIIAILAAIAVPNFLEAQTRSKVSRVLADVRSIRTGLESYRVDNNRYPETDLGAEAFGATGVGLFRITSPIAYMTAIPQSPFTETNIGHPAGSPQNAVKNNTILYVRSDIFGGTPLAANNDGGDGIDDNYQLDRVVYLRGETSVDPVNVGYSRQGFWMMKSVGPNNLDDRSDDQNEWDSGTYARVYDPTNGTVSSGDIVTFGDTEVGASQRGN